MVWSPFIGLIRSILALGSVLTLLFTSSDSLFRPVLGVGSYPLCRGVESWGLFCVFPREQLGLAKFVAIIILLLVISGLLPQLTGILHWWVAFSVASGISIPDGGDQITSNLVLLLIPVCVTDPRLNHWTRAATGTLLLPSRAGIAAVSLAAMKVQISILYFYSMTGKMFQTEWAEGSALYYIGSGFFGPSGTLKDAFALLSENPLISIGMTWGALLIELLLAVTLLTPTRYRLVWFSLGCSLHIGIALFLGIWTFKIAMFAALAVLTVPMASTVYISGLTLRRFDFKNSFNPSPRYSNDV
ncbi:sporulation-delaying protein SdpB family protein [Paenarthrobacter nitroguajacolicus]|uniref:sporulation-delaying protein SdpB family protein n=1 Tax=Paenarthrobacter nitroguajacolicus TaxID=211146 RepID=UPI004054359B